VVDTHAGTRVALPRSSRQFPAGAAGAAPALCMPSPPALNCRPVCECRMAGDCDVGKHHRCVCRPTPGAGGGRHLDQRLSAVHYAGVPVPPVLATRTLASSCRRALSGHAGHRKLRSTSVAPSSTAWRAGIAQERQLLHAAGLKQRWPGAVCLKGNCSRANRRRTFEPSVCEPAMAAGVLNEAIIARRKISGAEAGRAGRRIAQTYPRELQKGA